MMPDKHRRYAERLRRGHLNNIEAQSR